MPRRWVYRIRDAVGNAAVALGGIALAPGSFAAAPPSRLPGDLQISLFWRITILPRRLRRAGSVRQVPSFIETSARRYEELGAARTAIFYALIVVLYALGVQVATLHRLYRSYVGRCSSQHRGGRGGERGAALSDVPDRPRRRGEGNAAGRSLRRWRGQRKPRMLAITVLTSLAQDDLAAAGGWDAG